MNRNDWEKQVFSEELNPTAVAVALVAGSFGNWTDDRTVWPSTKAIADMAGIHRDTAQKYMDAFVEQGWLRVVKVRPGNIREYELCRPDAYPLGILARSKRTGNLPNSQATDEIEPDNQLPNGQASSCLTEPEQLPNGVVPVAYPLGTNLNEPTNKNLEELLETPAAPVVPIREEPDDSLPFLTTEEPTWMYNGVRYPSTKEAQEARKRDELRKAWEEE